ncbi:MBL fold metallo-hydrolase [Listeria booriae]|uniref:MBL fold metallo-hydrolase n=1 Tax=Listeria booriae TaxID=1552123 RepID=UPI001629632C|nr:MBL fold metallo-hydrolase [Listeria booriae]MBC2369920.1 MBL fold metallo-hydrolase [Listeria booriae]
MKITTIASGSAGNAYIVDDGISQLMLECGIRFQLVKEAMMFDFSRVAGLLITHEHGDHTKGVKDFIKSTAVDLYASEGTLEALNLEGYRIHHLASKKAKTIGSWRVLPFQTEHDAAEPLGFLLASQTGEKVLFATDTYYLKYTFKGITHLMLECNYSFDILSENQLDQTRKNRVINSHFSLENVKEFIKAIDQSKLKEVHLLHISEKNGDPERFKKEIQELTGIPVFIAGR